MIKIRLRKVIGRSSRWPYRLASRQNRKLARWQPVTQNIRRTLRLSPLALATLNPAMACPLCGRNLCSCASRTRARDDAAFFSSASDTDTVLVDPESWDDSEEQFESSLITSAKPDCYRSISLGPMNENVDNSAQAEQRNHIEAEAARARTGIAQRRALEQALEREAGQWREAISSKLDSYRDKRGRKQLSGEYTMHLDFERSAGRAAYASVAATAQALSPALEEQPLIEEDRARGFSEATQQLAQDGSVPEWDFPLNQEDADSAVADEDLYQSSGSEMRYQAEPMEREIAEAAHPEKPVEPPRVAPKSRRPQPRIIEFPRLFPVEQRVSTGDELAEPMLDRPRIIDVPEETEQIELPLAHIDFAPAEAAEQVPARRSEIETPMQVAAVSQRVFAAITDWVLVLLATAIFGGIVLNVAKGMPSNKLVLGMGLMVPCVFWGLYHYLFLVHAAVTPGMQMAQLRLASFNGQPTDRRIRRSRALAMLLSCASAGLGLVWAFVDEDTLCWHDKISRTYLTHK